MGLGVITAIGFVATVSFVAATHFATMMANYDRDAHETAAHALAAAQNTVLDMHANRLLGTQGEWSFAADDPAADAQVLANALAPPGVFTGVDADYTVIGTPNTTDRTIVLDGFEHSHGSAIGFVWRNRHVEMHLFGDFDADDHAGVAQHLPKTLWVRSPCGGTGEPECVDGLDSGLPAHDMAGADVSLAIIVPHPATRAGMGESVSLVDNDQPMFDAPVSFALASFVTAGAGCGGVPQLALDSVGRPMICVDMLGNGEGVWSRVGLAGIDSSGNGITNANTVGAQFYCVPDGLPALPKYKAPNMTVQFADHGAGTPEAHGAIVPVLVREAVPREVSCPPPQCSGSAGSGWLRLPAPEDYFCRFQECPVTTP